MDAGIHLMLAAGHGEDAPDAAVHGIGKGIVRGGVAGMERHHHVHRKLRLVAFDVPDLKVQVPVTVFLRGRVAVFDDVLLQTQRQAMSLR